jgi:hypothetical protein
VSGVDGWLFLLSFVVFFRFFFYFCVVVAMCGMSFIPRPQRHCRVKNTEKGDPLRPGSKYAAPESSQTLQMAPLLPQGISWTDPDTVNGIKLPGQDTELNTARNPWSGEFGRPGNKLQDSISTVSYLTPDFYKNYHTFGVDWNPGEWMRWYVDGLMVAEVNKEALKERTTPDGGGSFFVPCLFFFFFFLFVFWFLVFFSVDGNWNKLSSSLRSFLSFSSLVQLSCLSPTLPLSADL